MRCDLATVEHDAMADRHVVMENERILILHNVKDAQVLNVGVLANTDVMNVTPNDRVKPDAGVIADFDVANDFGAFRDEDSLSQPGQLPFVVQQHKSKRTTLTEAAMGIQGMGPNLGFRASSVLLPKPGHYRLRSTEYVPLTRSHSRTRHPGHRSSAKSTWSHF